jgi:GNAT superfamily N-acetyltransferase
MPDPIPVFVLGRLAIDKTTQGKGWGGWLLKDALKRCLAASREIGARAVLVHAIDDQAVAFYLQYGFKASPMETHTLFLPIGDIIAAL